MPINAATEIKLRVERYMGEEFEAGQQHGEITTPGRPVIALGQEQSP
jgi:hypothetical protein